MAADVQSGAALAGRSYLDPSANPRSGSCNDPEANAELIDFYDHFAPMN